MSVIVARIPIWWQPADTPSKLRARSGMRVAAILASMRVHLDVTSGSLGRDAGIERVLALGARRVDLGQSGKQSWTAPADPEGNEFCVIRPKTVLIR